MAASLGDEMCLRLGISESSYSARSMNWGSRGEWGVNAGICWSGIMVLLMEAGDEEKVNKFIWHFVKPHTKYDRRQGQDNGEIFTFKGAKLRVQGGLGPDFSRASDVRTDLLHVAASTGMQRAAFAFLAHGADPNGLDHLLRTPLQVAKTPEMRALLISAGAKPIEQPTAAIAAPVAPEAIAAPAEGQAADPAASADRDESARKLAATQARLAVMAASNARLRGADAALRASNASLSDTIAHISGVKRKSGDDDAAPDANEGADKRRIAKRWKAELIGLSEMGFISFARNISLLEKHVGAPGAGGMAAVLEELL